ncbi:MAG: alpha/beta superfamily hydrolase [Bradymonadia bacterium]|jgi:alpha/beta superfamily hydrolase
MIKTRQTYFIASALILFGCSSDSDAEASDETTVQDTATADSASANDTAADDTAADDTAVQEDVVDGDTARPDTPTADARPFDCDTQAGEVTFETEDGVTLVADYLPPTAESAPAVILFHMIPPSWDRASYPERVRNALNETGAAVLNVDRRGAGDSGGTAGDAYEGPGGRLDVEAAIRFLLNDEACTIDRARIALVGASNGTTSVMDYATAHADDLPDAARIAWLSPGTYTENQNAIADNSEALNELPVLIVYPDNEPWADQFQDTAPDAWTLVRIAGGGHGTINFDDGDNEAEQLSALIDWASQL